MSKTMIVESINNLISSKSEFYETVKKMRELADTGRFADDLAYSTYQEDYVPMNIISKYVDKMVSPYITSPVTIDICNNTDEGKIVKAFINQVEVDSCATQAYLSAIQGQMATGLGFVHVGITYNSDDNLESSICIDTVNDPTMCYINGDSMDGSDATLGVYFKTINKNIAESKYGEDLGENPFTGFSSNSDDVVSTIVYEKVITRKKRQWKNKLDYQDFNEDDIGFDAPIASRIVENPKVKMTHYVGGKIVSSANISIPYIPLIPFYGKRCQLRNDGVIYTGVANLLSGIQAQLNEYNIFEKILVSTTPPNTWVSSEEAIQASMKSEIPNFFNSTKVKRQPKIIAYTQFSAGKAGVVLDPPRKEDSTINNSPVITGKQALAAFAEELVGQLDTYSDNNDSGIALMMKSMETSKTTAPYVFKLTESIKQVGRVILWLLNEYYDYPRTVRVDDVESDIVFTELEVNPRIFKMEVISGPAVESNRMITIKSLMDIMTLHPASVPSLSKQLVKLLSIQNKDELLKVLDQLLPPELRDVVETEGQMDPEALAALEEAEMVINELQAEKEQEVTYWQGLAKHYYDVHMKATTSDQLKLDTQEMKSVENIIKEMIKRETELMKKGMMPPQPVDIESAIDTIIPFGDESQKRIDERDLIPELEFPDVDEGQGYAYNREDVRDLQVDEDENVIDEIDFLE